MAIVIACSTESSTTKTPTSNSVVLFEKDEDLFIFWTF